jgi:hypothetical protein
VGIARAGRDCVAASQGRGATPPLLARHNLVAAFHTVRRRLSVLVVALLSPLAARTLASATATRGYCNAATATFG